MARSRTLRIGTRASQLATWQANWVADQLRAMDVTVEIVPIRTAGDTSRGPIAGSGSVGVFTREIQSAVRESRVDMAVHSLKDLPTTMPAGLILAAVPRRASPFDALVSAEQFSLKTLPRQSRVGTGSPRRQAQLNFARPDLRVESIRGNVDTRLKKLDGGQFDAIVLAEAGLVRLNLAHRISQVLAAEICLPAAGQGALGIEIRDDDPFSLEVVRQLNHLESERAVSTERIFLSAIGAGCSAPVGAWCRQESVSSMRLDVVVFDRQSSESPTDANRLFNSFFGTADSPTTLAETAADWALKHGVRNWLSA